MIYGESKNEKWAVVKNAGMDDEGELARFATYDEANQYQHRPAVMSTWNGLDVLKINLDGTLTTEY